MQAFAGLEPVLFQLVDTLDVPSLYHIFTNEAELLPEGMHGGISKLLKEKHCIHFLCKKYRLPLQDDFLSFFAHWKRKYIFDKNNALVFVIEHAPSTFTRHSHCSSDSRSEHSHCSFTTFTQRKMLRKAAKERRFDFIDDYLFQHRLYKSWVDIHAICLGCAWSKERVMHYANLCPHDLGDADMLMDDCSARAYKKHYQNSGFDRNWDVEFFLNEMVAYGCWDDLRQTLADDLDEPLTLLDATLSTGLSKLFLKEFAFQNPDFVPKPGTYYAEFLQCYPEKKSPIPDDLRKNIVLGQFEENPKKILRVAPKLLYKLKGLYDPTKTLLEAEYVSDDFLEHLRYPLSRQSKEEIFNSYKGCYGKLIDIPPACCLDAIIWCCENDLFLEQRGETLEYAFSLLLNSYVKDASYSPLAIQYFCKHYLERWIEWVGDKEKLKAKLFIVVDGDTLMEEYIRKL